MRDRRETVDLLGPADIEHHGGDHEQQNPKEQHPGWKVSLERADGLREGIG